MAEKEALVRVENLKMYFPITQGIIIQRHVGDIKAVEPLIEALGLRGVSRLAVSPAGDRIAFVTVPG